MIVHYFSGCDLQSPLGVTWVEMRLGESRTMHASGPPPLLKTEQLKSYSILHTGFLTFEETFMAKLYLKTATLETLL